MRKNITQPKVEIIVGTTRPGRIGRAIADWFYGQTKQAPGMQFELVDLADWDLPLLDEPIPAKAHIYTHDHTKRWSAKIAEADAYVIVTPEYNAGYSAALKNALDYLYDEWSGKPVGFVAYGIDGGQGADKQLRQVATRLQMKPLPEKISIVHHKDMFDKHHQLVDPNKSLAEYADDAHRIVKALESALKRGTAS